MNNKQPSAILFISKCKTHTKIQALNYKYCDISEKWNIKLLICLNSTQVMIHSTVNRSLSNLAPNTKTTSVYTYMHTIYYLLKCATFIYIIF